MKYIIMISSLLLISNQVRAAWEIDVKFYPEYRQHLMKITRWDEDDQTANVLFRCGQNGNGLPCTLGIYATRDGSTDYTDSFPMPDKVSGMRTMGEVAKVFREQGHLNKGIWSKTVFRGINYCYYLGYYISTGPSTMSMIRVPGGVSDCPITEIIPTYCSIAEPYIELDHGSLSGGSVNGNTVSKQIHVTCNNDFNLAIRSKDSQGNLSLGRGLNSQLKVNGTDLGIGHSEVVGPSGKAFTLSSTLNGYTSGTGVFQGSSVIILGLP
ncbi:hypothetical protein [Serratia marcescens]|uniref:MrpH family fimbial adhesin n=1 Tax=Serratia TaxID=613 RepID=UPI00128E4D8D|nr:hypothetical protein [Serratia marcescens]